MMPAISPHALSIGYKLKVKIRIKFTMLSIKLVALVTLIQEE